MGTTKSYHPGEWQQIQEHMYKHKVTHELIKHQKQALDDNNNVKSYARRLEHQHTNVLTLLYYREVKGKCEACTDEGSVDVWVEDHPNEGIGVQGCDCTGLVRGCRYLYRRYGAFLVGEDKIWIKNNQYKIWINNNPFINTHHPASLPQMISSIIECLKRINCKQQHAISTVNFFHVFLTHERMKQEIKQNKKVPEKTNIIDHSITSRKHHYKNVSMELKPPRVSFNYFVPKQNISQNINRSVVQYPMKIYKAKNMIKKPQHTYNASLHSYIPSISSLDNLRKVKAGVESDRTQVQTIDISHVRNFQYKHQQTPNKEEKMKPVRSEQYIESDIPKDSSMLIPEERPSNSSVHSHEPYRSSGSMRPNQNNTISHDKYDKSPREPVLQHQNAHSEKDSLAPEKVSSLFISEKNVDQFEKKSKEEKSSQLACSRRQSDYGQSSHLLEKIKIEQQVLYQRQDGKEIPFTPHDPIESDLNISMSYKIPQRTKKVVDKYLQQSQESIQMPILSTSKQQNFSSPQQMESISKNDNVQNMLLESLRMEMFGNHAHVLQEQLQKLRKMYGQKDGEQEQIKKKVEEKKATFAELKAEAWKILENDLI